MENTALTALEMDMDKKEIYVDPDRNIHRDLRLVTIHVKRSRSSSICRSEPESVSTVWQSICVELRSRKCSETTDPRGRCGCGCCMFAAAFLVCMFLFWFARLIANYELQCATFPLSSMFVWVWCVWGRWPHAIAP